MTNKRITTSLDSCADLIEERDAAAKGLWECFVHAGGDTDGCDGWHCAIEYAVTAAVDAVKSLRECDDDDTDLDAAVARAERLETALREIADTKRHHRKPSDWRLPYEIARAALAAPSPAENALADEVIRERTEIYGTNLDAAIKSVVPPRGD